MNICILSMQRVDNFGSVLQSYSLKKILEQMGHNVEFLDIEPISSDNALLNINDKDNFREENEISSNNVFYEKLKKFDKYTLIRLSNKYKSKKQPCIFQSFREDYLNISKKSRSNHDFCVIGSDEVFSCLQKSPWGFTSQLFGNVKQADEVITYAASCGSTKIENVPPQVKQRISNAFLNIKAFSVRDNNTLEFTQSLCAPGTKIFVNLDPVIIGDFDEEMRNNPVVQKLPNHYCLIYSYRNRIHKKVEIKKVLSFCRVNNLTPVAIGMPQKWVSHYYNMTPFQLLNAFKNADFVITDTFHGTIFSAKYSKRFAVLIRESNKNKLNDLVNRLNLRTHVCSTFDDLNNVYNIINDIDAINKISQSERNKSIKYFREVLVKK